ncbi:MAG TPA: polymer-forming cytoskeletal protein [Anaerolineaceae bacterium]
MKSITKLTLLLILLAALVFPTAVFAAGVRPAPPADKVVLGGTYNLGDGQTLDGNLAVLGGTVTIDKGAVVNGDVFQAGGTLSIDGKVNGNLSALGGTVFLNANANIQGDVSTVGGTLHRDSGAKISGDVVNGAQGPMTFNTPQVFVPPVYNLRPLTDTLWFFFRTLAVAALAMLLGLFLPIPLSRVGQAVVQQPIISGGMGLLTAVISLILLILLAITLILIPVSVFGIFILIVAALFGWIAIGLEVGNRITELFKVQWPAAISAGIGTFVISFILNGIGFIPCVGWIAPTVVGLLGLGAVLLTRFGTIPYPPPGSPINPAAPVYVYPTPEPPSTNPGGSNPPSAPLEP